MNVDGNITCGTNILCDILTASTGVSANDITGGDITCSVGYIDTLISKDVTVTRSDELELIKLTTSTDSSRDMLIWGRPTGSTNSEIAVGALSVGNDDEGSIIRANTWDNSTGGDFVQLRDNITELRCASAVIMAVGEPTSSDCAATKNYVDAIGQNIIQANASDYVYTTNSSYEDMPNMEVTITTSGRPILILASVEGGSSDVGALLYTQLVIDGSAVASRSVEQPDADDSINLCLSFNWVTTASADAHTVKLQWRRGGTQTENFASNRTLSVIEL
jgi:hypothetical protein